MRAALVTAICWGILGGAALAIEAQTATKQTPPAPGPQRPFGLPPRTHYALPNGVQVNLLAFGSVPKVTIQVNEAAGKVNEDPKQTDLSAITAELMGEGTVKLSGTQIAQRAGDMGGGLSISGGSYSSSFLMDVLSSHASDAIALLADVLLHPAFPLGDFERLRTDHLRSRQTSLADPAFLADREFERLMYKDQAYGRLLPTEEMLKSYTLEDVRGFYKKNYGARRATIYVVGKFDEPAVRAAIAREFGGWAPGQEMEKPVQTASKDAQFAFVDRPGAAQSNVIYGLPVADTASADGTRLEVMDALLGGAFGSRITANIREQKGYTYSPYSSLSEGYKTNLWSESAAITSVSTGPALKAIAKEIVRLQQTPPSEEELTGIQRYLNGVFILRNSSRGGILRNLVFVDFHGLTDGYLTGYVARVSAVTPGQVQATAQQYLNTAAMSLVVVGDPAVAKPQVGDFMPSAK